MKILLTGATGFIGSNIAKGLLERSFEVYATFRSTSSFEKCSHFKNKINWINTEKSGWKDQIAGIRPDQLIHVAWDKIDSEDRNSWEIQIKNFWLSKEYFDLAKECEIKKVIAFGSQAEYGSHNFPVNEMTLPVPMEAYGAVKLLTANYQQNLFEYSPTEWYWLRVFSIFGEGENKKWLIPSVISSLLSNEPIRLTSCIQQYNYLYVEDFVRYVLSIVLCKENKSGIYNICSSDSLVLKDMLIKISELMNVSPDLLLFSEIPQRPAQNMIIAGENRKLLTSFDLKGYSPVGIIEGLRRTIIYYKELA
jgi:nucleoside-diphosphate-sugar epimerase